MPYNTNSKSSMQKVRERLSKTYQNVTDKMCRQFAHAFNAVWDKTNGNEGRSMAAGYAAVNKGGAKKKPRRGSALDALRRVASASVPASRGTDGSLFVALRDCPKPQQAPGQDYQLQRAYCRVQGRQCPNMRMIVPNGSAVICKAAEETTRTDS